MDGLVDAVGTFRYFTIGGVGVGGADITVRAVELADVFGQIPAGSVPGAVLLDGQRAGGYRLGGIPGDEPEARMIAAGVIAEGVVLHSALAGGIAGGRTTERVVAVLTVSYQRCAAMVRHAGEQISLYFVALRQGHVVRHGELLQQMRAGEVLIAELLFRAPVQESRGSDATI